MVRFGAIAVMLVLAAPLAALPVAGRGPVLVLLPPWTDAGAVVGSAGGRLIGPERAAFAVLAQGERADFAERLRAGGAWAVADGTGLARICGVTG